MNKQEKRVRRARRTRAKIKKLGVVRFCVHRSLSHIYVQLISSFDSKVLATASTLEREVRKK